MKRILLKSLILLLITAGFAGGWYWLEHKNKTAQKGPAAGPPSGPAMVTVAEVTARDFSTRIHAVGTVRSAESIELSANVSETVDAILFEDGAIVTNGQVLVLLSSAEEQAALAGAEANLAEQRREINRLKDLVNQGAAPEVRLQERITQAELAEQQILEVRAKLADRKIVAPFSGRLGLRRISPGALVTPGTLITTLDKIDTVKLDFTVPEVFLGELKPGLKFTATSSAYPDHAFEGTISSLDSRVDPVTRAIAVRALFENPDFKLHPGMLLSTVLESTPRQSPCVPERAISSSAQNHYLFVLTGTEEAPTVERRKVVLGRRIMGYVEVPSGVEVGERVVADGIMGLRGGGEVKIIGTFEGPVKPFDPTRDQAGQP